MNGIEPTGEDGAREFPRRPLLTLLALGGGAVLGGAATEAGPAGLVSDLLAALLGPADTPQSPLLVARPDDGLLVSLSFTNLDVHTISGQRRLVLRDPTTPGLVTIGLTAQSVFEQSSFDNGSSLSAPPQPVPALVSGPSRIVLRVPAGTAPFPYDLPTLLDLARFPLELSPAANGGQPAAPAVGETAIEAPFRLFLSPTSAAAFTAAKNPVTRNGRTELWHARAVPKLADGTLVLGPATLPVRATWTPDIVSSTDLPDWATTPGSAALLPGQRTDIVTNSLTQAPAQASLLLVSPLGASLDLTARWTGDGVVGWQHQAWLGRDTYVRVEEAGFLFPFGFPAEKVTVTQRIIVGGEAFLRTQQFVVVRRPSVDYPQETELQPAQGRGQPFTRVTTATLVSPPLFAPITSGEFVTIAGENNTRVRLRYKLTLTTKDGRTVAADLPLVFLDATHARKDTVGPFVDTYNNDSQTSPELRTLRLDGQKVAFVPPAPPADHALPTSAILLGVGVAGADRAGEQAAFPLLRHADVHIEELDALGGTQGQLTRLSYDDGIYLVHGFGDGNRGEVWAKLGAVPAARAADQAADQALRFALSQATGGGMAAPSFAVDALSRVHGTVTDATNIAENKFNPQAYFTSDAITLLGAIPLSKVIEADARPGPPDDENIPKIRTERAGDKVTTVITWQAKLKRFPGGDGNLFTFVPADDEDDRRLRMEVRLTTARDGSTSSVVRGELRHASLVFLNMIAQPVERLSFESHNGAKPAIDLQLGLPQFLGDLRFLAKLQEFLPALPGGVKIDRTPAGIRAGMTLAVPSVPIGVVLVQNLAVGVALDLPLTGAPATLSFSFATRERPFRATVMALGGGGFLTIGLSTAGGPPAIEGALEFGAAVALDLGVASGSVSIMAGIYVAYGRKLDAQGREGPDTVVITGYIRALGSLSVLGLIHASVEFYLGLTFVKELDGASEGRVQGEATLRIRVEVFLFSTEVSVTMRKEIGSGVDPSFGDQVSAADWSSYCAAFAEED